jgi:NADH-quinone oxidoreductase subunit M
MDSYLLSLLIGLPILAAAIVLALGEKHAHAARGVALVSAIVVMLLAVNAWVGFDASSANMQYVQRLAWVPAFNIYYHVGVDGIALPLVLLTTVISALVLIAGWEVIERKVAQYYAAFLVLEGLMIGVFCAMDAMLFYVFFEAMLIPMFIIIGVWGGPRRVYASIKFFLYTFLGSIFMLLGLIYLYQKSGDSFALSDWTALSLSANEQFWLFWAFFAAFAVKIPMFPVHTWLPDAHVEAPTGGSIILAAIMLKIGGYGFVRFSLPITPDASASYAYILIALSLIAVVYIGLVALVQQDMKKLVAYSSISHMGFVTLGLFLAYQLAADARPDTAALAIQGSLMQMLSHGFVSAAMFGAIGVLYDRVHSREIADYGGVLTSMPYFGSFAIFFGMANCGLPGTSGFVGEFMVILAAVQANPWVGFMAATALILGAAYTLWLLKRVFLGPITHKHVKTLEDLNPREWVLMGTLAIYVLYFGLFPKPFTDVMQPSVVRLVEQISISKLPIETARDTAGPGMQIPIEGAQ